MTPERYGKIKRVFLRVRELPSHARKAYLDESCGGDVELRASIDKLLADEQHATQFLESPVLPTDALRQTSVDKSKARSRPDRIGRYRILAELGEGGMGIVYLAEQREPVRRRVALKVIKPGMDSKAIIARFEAEQQALAVMNHPNIAKVFDAGVTDQGRPYFVMEHIAGVRITEHCDRQKLSIDERLELFTRVCEAIQHAHQQGVIHRDIKPSNVLVSIEGDKITPKVIDFGVAKAISHPLTEQTIFTQRGQLIGTPEYMSPEQAEMSDQQIDTRSDIYSLGALLYELLTSALPFDRKSLHGAALAEIQRIIREEDPQKPSTRFGGLGPESDSIAETRRCHRNSLEHRLRGDLDWITMKALAKDRIRRYATASDLASDIARHLRHEPVLAGPPVLGYRVSKLLRRHRWTASGIAVVVVALSLATVGWVAASRERSNAVAARSDEAQAQAEADQQRVKRLVDTGTRETEAGHWNEAEAAFTKARQIDARYARAWQQHARLMVQRFNALGASDDDRYLLEEALHVCERGLDLDPTDSRGRSRLGIILKKLGHYSESIDAYREAIRLDPEFFAAWVNVATVYALNGDLELAEEGYKRAIVLANRETNKDYRPYSAQAWRNLASLQLFRGGARATESIEEAIARNPTDVASRVIHARALLVPTGLASLEQAFDEAKHADALANGGDARAKRLLALIWLRKNQPERAAQAARDAIMLRDSPAINQLIICIAKARLGRPDESRVHLKAADDTWPEELIGDGAYIAAAPEGILWFDTGDELRTLHQEAVVANDDQSR